jgi:uncharacterized protein
METARANERKLQVRDNPAGCRFEIYVDRQLAGYLRYRIDNGGIWLIETAVGLQHCIDNLVPDLVGRALASARQRGLTIRPISPAVRRFMAIHSGDAPPADGLQQHGRKALP